MLQLLLKFGPLVYILHCRLAPSVCKSRWAFLFETVLIRETILSTDLEKLAMYKGNGVHDGLIVS